jgi:DUF4097 and DUF4098 domain-containing protein YvlB
LSANRQPWQRESNLEIKFAEEEQTMEIMKRTAHTSALGLLTLGLLSLVLLSVACRIGAGTETKENTFKVGGEPTIEIRTGNGFIHVETGANGAIDVKADLRDPENVEYSATQSGDKITVRARTRSSGAKADITVTLPENTAYTLDTGNGAIEITGLAADGTAASGNGSVKLKDGKGSIGANAGNGAIEVTAHQGDLMMNAGNGSITVRDSSGSFNLNAGNGKISVNGGEGSFQLNAGNGEITLNAGLIPGSKNSLSSGNGKVTVEFLGTPSVQLDLEIEQEGHIRNSLDVTVDEQSDWHLIGTVGDGDSSLRIRTGRGDIVLK